MGTNTEARHSVYYADVMQLFDSAYVANHQIRSITVKTFDGRTQQYTSEFELHYNEYNQLTRAADFVHYLNPVYDDFIYNDAHLLSRYYFINKDTIIQSRYLYNQNEQVSDIQTIKLIDSPIRKYQYNFTHMQYGRDNKLDREFLITLSKIPYTAALLLSYRERMDTSAITYYTYDSTGYTMNSVNTITNKITREIHTCDTAKGIKIRGASEVKSIRIYEDKLLTRPKIIYTLMPNNKIARYDFFYSGVSNNPDSIFTTVNNTNIQKICFFYNGNFQPVEALVKDKNNKQKNRKVYFYKDGLLINTFVTCLV